MLNQRNIAHLMKNQKVIIIYYLSNIISNNDNITLFTKSKLYACPCHSGSSNTTNTTKKKNNSGMRERKHHTYQDNIMAYIFSI